MTVKLVTPLLIGQPFGMTLQISNFFDMFMKDSEPLPFTCMYTVPPSTLSAVCILCISIIAYDYCMYIVQLSKLDNYSLDYIISSLVPSLPFPKHKFEKEKRRERKEARQIREGP